MAKRRASWPASFLLEANVLGEFIKITVLDNDFLISLDTNTVRQVLSRDPKTNKATVRTIKEGALTKRLLEIAREYAKGRTVH